MGEYARKYTKGNVDELINLFKNKAYADEWIAYYYYEVGAELVKTLDGKITADRQRNQHLRVRFKIFRRPVQKFLGTLKLSNLRRFIHGLVEVDEGRVRVPSNMTRSWGALAARSTSPPIIIARRTVAVSG